MKKLEFKEFNKHFSHQVLTFVSSSDLTCEQDGKILENIVKLEIHQSLGKITSRMIASRNASQITIPISEDGYKLIAFCAAKFVPVANTQNLETIDLPCSIKKDVLILDVKEPAAYIVNTYHRVLASKIGTWTLIKTFLKEISHVPKAFLQGRVFATKNMAAERIKICESCDKLQIDTYRCSVCGCFMKAKIRLFFSKCPENKW